MDRIIDFVATGEAVEAEDFVKTRIAGTKPTPDSGWFWTIFLPDGSVTLSDWATAIDVANRESARISSVSEQPAQA